MLFQQEHFVSSFECDIQSSITGKLQTRMIGNRLLKIEGLVLGTTRFSKTHHTVEQMTSLVCRIKDSVPIEADDLNIILSTESFLSTEQAHAMGAILHTKYAQQQCTTEKKSYALKQTRDESEKHMVQRTNEHRLSEKAYHVAIFDAQQTLASLGDICAAELDRNKTEIRMHKSIRVWRSNQKDYKRMAQSAAAYVAKRRRV
jgi:hypothetical protein